ncbi:hypothetical protein GCM10028787_32240 [Brachybacterium horti]
MAAGQNNGVTTPTPARTATLTERLLAFLLFLVAVAHGVLVIVVLMTLLSAGFQDLISAARSVWPFLILWSALAGVYGFAGWTVLSFRRPAADTE